MLKDTHIAILIVLVGSVIGLLYILSNDCRVCDIMHNPPDYIETWYTGEAKWNTTEKGPTE